MTSGPEEFDGPDVSYTPPMPKTYEPSIGFIGCGYISDSHLAAYAGAGFDVVALCNRTISKAEEKRERYYPNADVYSDYADVLERPDVDVVVATPHPKQREPILKDAIRAGKHVLSQKPLAVDLDFAEELVAMADAHDVKLAVHQPMRWDPHFNYVRQAVRSGILGTAMSTHLTYHFDHEEEILDTKFEEVGHILLYDLGIHYFDYVVTVMDRRPETVWASLDRAPNQTAVPPLLGQAHVEFDTGQSSVVTDGCTKRGQERRIYVAGTEGSARTIQYDDGSRSLRLSSSRWSGEPTIEEDPHANDLGTLTELLCAIEEDREPSHSAANNLASLELCFAAVASAETGEPKTPGEVREMYGAVK